MLIINPLVLSQIPSMAYTFGASAMLFSPILNLLLIAAAILILVALFKSDFVRNIFAGLGFVGLMNYLFSSNDRTHHNHSSIFEYPSQHQDSHRRDPFHSHHSEPSSRNFSQNFNPVHQHPNEQHQSCHRNVHRHASSR